MTEPASDCTWPTGATVPAAAAALCGAADAGALCAVMVGDRVEVDLDALYRLDPEAAGMLFWYFTQAKEFWSGLADGSAAGGYQIVRRVLVKSRQRDGRDGRVDLTAELEALEAMPASSGHVDMVLAAAPDWVGVQSSGASIERDGDKAKVELGIVAPVWDRRLGGAPSPGELKRVVTLETNHAKWRDRKVRRLVAVTVEAEEIWPVPAG